MIKAKNKPVKQNMQQTEITITIIIINTGSHAPCMPRVVSVDSTYLFPD